MSTGNLGRSAALRRNRESKMQQSKQGSLTQKLVEYLDPEKGVLLVPIISNSVRNDWILDGDFNRDVGFNTGKQIKVPDMANIEQELAQLWAEEIDYPFQIPSPPKSLLELLYPEDIDHNKKKYENRDTTRILEDDFAFKNDFEKELVNIIREYMHVASLGQYNHLASVAQYKRFDTGNPLDANQQYLTFLKNELLTNIASKDENNSQDFLDELKELMDAENYSFSDLVHDLGYPRFNEEHPDLLRKLAQLPIRIYITTSYYDFLERVLQAEGKSPKTQVCFFREQGKDPSGISEEHRTDPRFNPTVTEPLVYHLFGFEKYPASMVTSEDDYLKFLITIATDKKQKQPIIPHYLKQALKDSSLLLLGYRLQDWDFRILFHGIIGADDSNLRKHSVAIQLDPNEQEIIRNAEKAETYLRQYFERANLNVVWKKTDEFINELWCCYDDPKECK